MTVYLVNYFETMSFLTLDIALSQYSSYMQFQAINTINKLDAAFEQ